MKILTFTSLFPNRMQPILGVFIYQRLSHFARRPGNSVEVVAPVPYFPRWFRWKRWGFYAEIPGSEKVTGLSVFHPRYPLLPKIAMPLHGLLMFLGCFYWVLQLKKKIGFVCIDTHFVYPDGFAAILLGKLLRVPVICSARGTDITLYPSFALIRPQIRWTLEQAAGIIAVSNSLKESIVKLGIPAEKIRVVGNGVDVGRFGPMDRGQARRQLGLRENDPVLISVASLQVHKGHQFLISALADLRNQFPNLKLYILGEGPFRKELERLITEKNLEGCVYLKGNRPNEELRLWYNSAEVSCLVSAREGWPNVLLESIGCGTPVLATNVGGVSEVITSSELGVIVEQTTVSIKEGLERALRKTWNRDVLVRHARKRTWDNVAEEMETYFLKCLES
jgi:glycosyltransferase involved in cell wall biosynthesis